MFSIKASIEIMMKGEYVKIFQSDFLYFMFCIDYFYVASYANETYSIE